MKIIKCNICKLDKSTCDYKCATMEDVSELYIEGVSEEDTIPERFCTAHKCPHNPTGFKCETNQCPFGHVIGA